LWLNSARFLSVQKNFKKIFSKRVKILRRDVLIQRKGPCFTVSPNGNKKKTMKNLRYLPLRLWAFIPILTALSARLSE